MSVLEDGLGYMYGHGKTTINPELALKCFFECGENPNAIGFAAILLSPKDEELACSLFKVSLHLFTEPVIDSHTEID